MIYFGDVLLNLKDRVLWGALTAGLSFQAIYGVYNSMNYKSVTEKTVPIEIPSYPLELSSAGGFSAKQYMGDLKVKIYRKPLEGIVGFETNFERSKGEILRIE